MQQHADVERLLNLLDPAGNVLLGTTDEQAEAAVASGDPARIEQIDGHFAILQEVGNLVRMARSIGRPMRYFLAKQVDGPCLVVAERIDEIAEFLKQEGMDDQFHPSYTSMVPAHSLTELARIGCPDPSPDYTRFFTPERNALPADVNEIGRRYIGTLQTELAKRLDQIDSAEPLGGAVLRRDRQWSGLLCAV